MRTKVLFYIFACGLACLSCTDNQVALNVFCEKDSRDNYVLKWEIFPDPAPSMMLDIYVSATDSAFPGTPTLSVKADDYIATINIADSVRRAFFKVRAGKTVSGVIGNRFFKLDSIQNFRDMGGYYTLDSRQIRWGKLYRSGTFSKMSDKDVDRLQKLNIKTAIDLRAKDTQSPFPIQRLNIPSYIRLPIGMNGYEAISDKIMENRFLRGDAIIFTQDMYRNFVEKYTGQYADLFDYLCDESIYPVVYNCLLGKDQSGLATYFLLCALGVSPEVAEEDYMLSNRGVNRSLLFKSIADEVSESKEEVMIMISNTDLSYLRYALSCIRKKHGSVDHYMETELGLTPEKREKLRSILLY